jgi:glycosyltransferase involved in cell wall biosynthesis
VSDAVRQCIAPFANGPTVVIRPGIPIEAFGPGEKSSGSVLILATKAPEFGRVLQQALTLAGVDSRLLTKQLPRSEFAQLLSSSEIFVGLPRKQEGFYLPGLEALASGCAVICPDAVGNREYCIDQVNCIMPEYLNLDAHVAAVKRLVTEVSLLRQLQRRGRSTAEAFSLQAERQQFHNAIDQHVLVDLVVAR